MKWKGTLVHEDLGAGVWVLEAEDGSKLQLHGDVPARLAGCQVEVEGTKNAGFGFGMIGASAIEVKRISEA